MKASFKPSVRITFPAVLLLVFGSIACSSQPGPLAAGYGQGGGFGGGMKYRSFLTPANLSSYQGTIEQVFKMPARRRGGFGTHLILKTSAESIEVRLGPQDYIDAQPGSAGLLKEGNRVGVKGYPVSDSGRRFILAAIISNGETEMKLRGDDGRPLWKMNRNRRRQVPVN